MGCPVLFSVDVRCVFVCISVRVCVCVCVYPNSVSLVRVGEGMNSVFFWATLFSLVDLHVFLDTKRRAHSELPYKRCCFLFLTHDGKHCLFELFQLDGLVDFL